ncbi:MAG: cell envelope integrity protein TolA, partial [Candidatus Solibacter sp.]|nr:cell envelope integrity protein TolA [Candidatus Solibacter sp.]
STLIGGIRNDTPNDLTSLDFEVVAYDQLGTDVRMCDPSNTGLKCAFHISTRLHKGESVEIDQRVGRFPPQRVIPKKQHITRMEWRVLAAQFTPIPVEPKLSFTPSEGDIVVWDIVFGSRTNALTFLSFRLVNQIPFIGSDSAPGLSSMVRIALQADGSCEGKPIQWISDSNWLRPHSFKFYYNFWKTNAAIAADTTCEVKTFSGTLVLDADSAMADSYKLSLPFRIDVVGERLNSNALIFHVKDRIPQILAKQAADKVAADKAQAEQEARSAIEAEKRAIEAEKQRIAAEEQAAIDRKTAIAETARRKRLAEEQKKKDAELNARLAKDRAEKEAAAAEERRRLRANCTAIYQNTIDKKVKELTVREEQHESLFLN